MKNILDFDERKEKKQAIDLALSLIIISIIMASILYVDSSLKSFCHFTAFGILLNSVFVLAGLSCYFYVKKNLPKSRWVIAFIAIGLNIFWGSANYLLNC